MSRPQRTLTARKAIAFERQRARDDLSTASKRAGLRPGPMRGCDLDGGCDACDAGIHDVAEGVCPCCEKEVVT